MSTNAFLDAAELLNGDPGFWVFWTEEIFDQDADEYRTLSGAYHWLTDVYVRVNKDAGCLIITFSHPDESEWYYTTEPELIRSYLDLLNTLHTMYCDIQEADSRV